MTRKMINYRNKSYVTFITLRDSKNEKPSQLFVYDMKIQTSLKYYF